MRTNTSYYIIDKNDNGYITNFHSGAMKSDYVIFASLVILQKDKTIKEIFEGIKNLSQDLKKSTLSYLKDKGLDYRSEEWNDDLKKYEEIQKEVDFNRISVTPFESELLNSGLFIFEDDGDLIRDLFDEENEEYFVEIETMVLIDIPNGEVKVKTMFADNKVEWRF